MKKIIYMGLLTSILTFLGCKSEEEKILESHQILFYKTNEFENFINEAKIKPEEAKKIMIDFAKNNDFRKPHLFYNRQLLCFHKLYSSKSTRSKYKRYLGS